MTKVYRTQGRGIGNTPDYIIRDGRFYRTVDHPAGWSEAAEFEIGRDGKVYVLEGEPAGPVYVFQDILLYRTHLHPQGAGVEPDYYISD